MAAPQYAEFTGPIVVTNGGFGTNWGTFTADTTAPGVNNSFIQAFAPGVLKVLAAGCFDVQGIVLPSTAAGSPPPGKTNLTMDAGGRRVAAVVGGDYGSRETSIGASGIYLPAGATISFNVATANSVALGSRVTVTKTR
jgi:hypothetical protein